MIITGNIPDILPTVKTEEMQEVFKAIIFIIMSEVTPTLANHKDIQATHVRTLIICSIEFWTF